MLCGDARRWYGGPAPIRVIKSFHLACFTKSISIDVLIGRPYFDIIGFSVDSFEEVSLIDCDAMISCVPKARRNSRKGMAVEDFKSVHELKMEDLAKKDRLSKLAILDTLLAKKEPTEREENAMGLDYSYTQPSESEDYGLGGSTDSGNSSTEMYIQLDQAQIEAARHQYPPQPEVEFGFPKECYCGGEPLVATSYTRTDPVRMFYTCTNKQDRDCHVYKWWDVAATEEIKAIGAQVTLLTDKVDSLSFVGYEETELRELKEVQFDMEQKLVRLESIVCDLGRKKSRFGNGFELVVGVLVVVLVIIAFGVAARM
ncbi:hypothetical protein F2Q69_00044909 [Brassica cretica]|uniref:GRF-type domain-containing protein n=1 Tax=Brassica cretica TaxID=69181 RepID=A0A8S9NB19_BRACR|nr:hypothetical protein F2Q69_00044909 [Brassica cretica]